MVNISLELFYQDMLQEILVKYAAEPDTNKTQIFIENVGAKLEEDAELESIVWNDYTQDDMEVAGYSFDSERGILTIIGSHYFYSSHIETITKDIFEKKFKKLKKFFTESVKMDNPLYKQMSFGGSGWETAKFFHDKFTSHSIRRIILFIITNGSLSKYTKEITSDKLNEIPCDFQVFDINRIYQIALQENSLQDIAIDFSDYNCHGLSCLKAAMNTDDYCSYLTALPGNLISAIYDRYGQRLFEQNVRTFLQLKRKVNNGMHITIKEAPERFFAYNNGLTCTASEVEIEQDGEYLVLKKLKGLQIVNGGQTTSVIYSSFKKNIDVSKIMVQMKLSVVSNEDDYSDFVAKVARYANTQNPVKESDFFSNSPFHKSFKELSERIMAPVVGGKQIRTKWFYERTRGQYLNEKNRAKSEKEFLQRYPKEQMVDKILLAKSEVIFDNMPHLSTKSNTAFSKFVTLINDKLQKDEYCINEIYFKELIAKIILVKKTDEMIATQEWAKNKKSIRAYIKAYAAALLNEYVLGRGKFLDFMNIWEKQTLSDDFCKAVLICIDNVKEYLEQPGDDTDLREILGREYSWKNIKELRFEIPESILNNITIENDTIKYERREARKQQKVETGINKLKFIFEEVAILQWQNLLVFFNKNRSIISPKEYAILEKFASDRNFVPSDKQAAVLYDIYQKAKSFDVRLN